jgi:chromosome segregation ATPase
MPSIKPIAKLSLVHRFQRWRTARIELLAELDALRSENEELRQKLVTFRQAKVRAEKHAEDRRHEKEALRAKLNAQRKALETQELLVAQLGAKIAELRAENDDLMRAKKKSG